MGLLLVYTGDGKGKTTAAVGMALRAAGHHMRALMIQFLKGGPPSGELEAARQYLPLFTVVQAGHAGFVRPGNIGALDHQQAQDALYLADAAFRDGGYQLIILDEINVAMRLGLLSPQEVLETVARRQPEQHVILTGRWAPPQIVDAADMVSEIRAVKHHFDVGVRAQAGVEF